jgi:hypothetical protein
MLLRSTLVAMFAFPTLISVVNGIISGLPRRRALGFRDLAETVSGNASTPPTPGKLRVVENSGVCGGVILFATHPLLYSHSQKKLRRVSIRLPDMVTCPRIRAFGLCTILSVPSGFYLCFTKQVLVLCCTQ